MESPAPNHNHQKKIALINDVTGFGRCSAAVQLPIISQLGVQCCVLPTSILSNHTGFPSYSFQDFTPHMREHIAEWRKLGLQFRGICTGFLGSAEQIAIVSEFIEEFGGPRCTVLVDPVMGDEGKPYGTYTPEMCARMAELAAHADIITPNLTEACILAGRDYDASIGTPEALQLARELSEMGPSRVVVTGVEAANTVANVCFERGAEPFTVATERPTLGVRRRVLGHHSGRRGERRAVRGVGAQSVAIHARLRARQHRFGHSPYRWPGIRGKAAHASPIASRKHDKRGVRFASVGSPKREAWIHRFA
mgnify:CR=1 FL=1